MSRTHGDTVRQSGWLAIPLVGVLLIVGFLLLPPASAEQSALYDAAGLGAVTAALVALRLHRPAGWRLWLFLALGQLGFALGDVIWTIYGAQGLDPFPSQADALYLLGYPIMAIGLSFAIRRRITTGDRSGLLDAAILATGVAVVWWAFVLGPLRGAADPNPLAFAISLAYPIGDLLLIGLILGLIMTSGVRSVSFWLLGANLAIMLAADLAFNLQDLAGTYVDGGLLDVAWIVAYMAFGAAALHPSMRHVFDPSPAQAVLLGPTRLILMAAAMLVGPALLVVGNDDAGNIVVVVAAASALLAVLVLARLATMVRLLARDIERRKELEAQLSYQAYHDPLTGLANRRGFMAAVGEALASGAGTAALFVDLDDFKNVNDDMGHDAGDALLSAVGHRFVAAVRPGDLACRLGGDEFAVLLRDTTRIEDAEGVAARLLQALSATIEIEGVALRISGSVGVSISRAGDALSVDDLVRRADVAMYYAKARGKHRTATYSPDMEMEAELAPARTTVRRPAPAA